MSKKRCHVCVGSGTMMGGGMMMEECRNCDGTGKIHEKENKKENKKDKKQDVMKKESDEYQGAKDKIKSLDEKMTDEEAEKLLDEELYRQNNVDKIK